jgi:F-type H+-transporting ATPase subunit delta
MAESIDEMMDVADVYAAALHALALPAQAVKAIYEELRQVVELAERDRTFGEFLRSSAIDAEKRAASLDRMFRGKLSDTLLDTLQVMNRHGRLETLPAMLRCFVVRAEAAAGMVEVRVRSAIELTPEQRLRIEALAAELSKRKPIMEFAVDPDVLGGLVMQINDFRYDYSLRRQLQLARARLRERGERGIRRTA